MSRLFNEDGSYRLCEDNSYRQIADGVHSFARLLENSANRLYENDSIVGLEGINLGRSWYRQLENGYRLKCEDGYSPIVLEPLAVQVNDARLLESQWERLLEDGTSRRSPEATVIPNCDQSEPCCPILITWPGPPPQYEPGPPSWIILGWMKGINLINIAIQTWAIGNDWDAQYWVEFTIINSKGCRVEHKIYPQIKAWCYPESSSTYASNSIQYDFSSAPNDDYVATAVMFDCTTKARISFGQIEFTINKLSLTTIYDYNVVVTSSNASLASGNFTFTFDYDCGAGEMNQACCETPGCQLQWAAKQVFPGPPQSSATEGPLGWIVDPGSGSVQSNWAIQGATPVTLTWYASDESVSPITVDIYGNVSGYMWSWTKDF